MLIQSISFNRMLPDTCTVHHNHVYMHSAQLRYTGVTISSCWF